VTSSPSWRLVFFNQKTSPRSKTTRKKNSVKNMFNISNVYTPSEPLNAPDITPEPASEEDKEIPKPPVTSHLYDCLRRPRSTLIFFKAPEGAAVVLMSR
jgi:hypothetical protein